MSDNFTKDDDVWAYFARNWGNEGYCSSGVEWVDDSVSTFSLLLPQPGASGVSVESEESLCRFREEGSCGISDVQLKPNEGAVVSFVLPPARRGERFNGVIHLKWTTTTEKHNPPPITPPPITMKEAPELRKDSWIQRMTEDQRAIYERQRPRSEKDFDRMTPPPRKRRPIPPRRPLVVNSLGLIRKVPDANRDLRDRQEFEAIKAAYGGSPPDYPLRTQTFVLPKDGIPNNNRTIGPFCCTGRTATVLSNDNREVGYIYFFAWTGQALNRESGSFAPDLDILVSAATNLFPGASPGSSQMEKGHIHFAGTAIAPGSSSSTRVGALEYVATIERVKTIIERNQPYFDMASLVVRVDVSIAP